jgi:hypothetical protein
MKATILMAAIVVMLAIAPTESKAQIIVSVRPSPPPVVVVRPVAPAPDYMWIDGYWVYSRPNRGYTWHDGYWVASRPGYAYAPGYWVELKGKGHKWQPGGWVRQGGGPSNSNYRRDDKPQGPKSPGNSKSHNKGGGKGKH